jgi:hypothetical protein
LYAAKDRLTRAQSAIEGKELPNLSEFATAENKAAECSKKSVTVLAVLAKISASNCAFGQAGKLEERSKMREEIYKNTSSLAQCAQGNNSKRLTSPALSCSQSSMMSCKLPIALNTHEPRSLQSIRLMKLRCPP